MRLLLDTHALIWFAFDDPKLSSVARRVLLTLENEVLVSAASAWEVTTKVRIGKFHVCADEGVDSPILIE